MRWYHATRRAPPGACTYKGGLQITYRWNPLNLLPLHTYTLIFVSFERGSCRLTDNSKNEEEKPLLFPKIGKFHESSDRMNFAATRTKRVDPSSMVASILQKLETTWPWLEKREKGTLFKNERMRGDAMQVHPARPTLRFFCAMRDNSTL